MGVLGNQPLHVGTQLRGGGPEGIGGLQRMSRLNTSAATAASPHMDIESTHQGLTRNLDLELRMDVVFFGEPATLGALFGQRHIDDLVGLVFGKGAMRLGAIVGARLAARLSGGLLNRSFGERSGLAFLGPRGLLQKLLQLRHSLLEFSDPPFEPGTVGTSCSCDCIASHNTDIGKMAA